MDLDIIDHHFTCSDRFKADLDLVARGGLTIEPNGLPARRGAYQYAKFGPDQGVLVFDTIGGPAEAQAADLQPDFQRLGKAYLHEA